MPQSSPSPRAWLASLPLLAPMLAGPATAAPPPCTAVSPTHTVALVELYTSQGCSSCPPADRWLSRLQPGDELVPLALHVGYWDSIGWKDRFARREFSERQRTLANAGGNRVVYTPGVFVQGREMPRWADAGALRATLAALRATPAAARIELHAHREADTLVVAGQASAPAHPGARLQLALTQGGHRTSVNAGENRGEVLGNDHVVRSWAAAAPLGAVNARLALPEASAGPLTLVAFVEDGSRVLQALPLALQRCGA